MFEVPDSCLEVADVVARLDELDGKTVWVRGVLSLEFEGQELRGTDDRALWIEFATHGVETMGLSLSALDGRQVVVRGSISTEETGHGSLWPGALIAIDRVIKAKALGLTP